MPCPHELGPPATASSRSLALPEGPWTLEPFPRKDALESRTDGQNLKSHTGCLVRSSKCLISVRRFEVKVPRLQAAAPPPNPSRGGGQLQPPKIPRFSFSFSPTSLLLKKKKNPAHVDFRSIFFSTNSSTISYLISLAFLPSLLSTQMAQEASEQKIPGPPCPPPPPQEGGGDRLRVLRCEHFCANHFFSKGKWHAVPKSYFYRTES